MKQTDTDNGEGREQLEECVRRDHVWKDWKRETETSILFTPMLQRSSLRRGGHSGLFTQFSARVYVFFN